MLTRLAQWIGRPVISLVFIILILLGGRAFLPEIQDFKNGGVDLSQLRQQRDALAEFLKQEFGAAKARVAKLHQSADNALLAHIASIDKQIRQLEGDDLEIGLLDIFKGRALEKAKAKLWVAVLQEEKQYVQGLHAFLLAASSLADAKAELERRRQVHVAAYNALQANVADQAAVKSAHPIRWQIWWTAANWQWWQLSLAHQQLLQSNSDAYQDYLQQQKVVESIPELRMPAKFTVSQQQIDDALGPIDEWISAFEKKREANWISKLIDSINEVLPAALLILAGVFLAPLVIKTFLYYVVARLASGRPPVQLVPEARGDIAVGDGERSQSREVAVAAVSRAVRIGAGDEMLIHAEYLQSTSDVGSKRTKWLLDWSIPFSSLASGMVALTRIRSDSDQSFVVSATKDPLSEVGLIAVPPSVQSFFDRAIWWVLSSPWKVHSGSRAAGGLKPQRVAHASAAIPGVSWPRYVDRQGLPRRQGRESHRREEHQPGRHDRLQCKSGVFGPALRDIHALSLASRSCSTTTLQAGRDSASTRKLPFGKGWRRDGRDLEGIFDSVLKVFGI